MKPSYRYNTTSDDHTQMPPASVRGQKAFRNHFRALSSCSFLRAERDIVGERAVQNSFFAMLGNAPRKEELSLEINDKKTVVTHQA